MISGKEQKRSRGVEEERRRGAEEQRSRGAKEQRSRGAKEQRSDVHHVNTFCHTNMERVSGLIGWLMC